MLESSVRVKEENHDVVNESKLGTHHSFPGDESTALSKLGRVCDDGASISLAEGAFELDSGIRKRRQKSTVLRVRIDWFLAFSCKIDPFFLPLKFNCSFVHLLLIRYNFVPLLLF